MTEKVFVDYYIIEGTVTVMSDQCDCQTCTARAVTSACLKGYGARLPRWRCVGGHSNEAVVRWHAAVSGLQAHKDRTAVCMADMW